MVYGNIFGPIINILGIGLGEIRILSLLLHLLSGLFLAYAVKLKLYNYSKRWSPLYTYLITFTPLILYGIQGRVLSYNSLTFCLASLTISCFIISSICKNNMKNIILVFICGIFIGIQFGVKFPTFIVFFVLGLLTILSNLNYTNLLLFLIGNYLGIITVNSNIDLSVVFDYYSTKIHEYGFAGFHGSESFLDLYLNSIYIQFLQAFTKLDMIIVICSMLYINRTCILNSIIVTFLFCYLLFRSWHCSYFQSGESAFFCATPWFLSAVSVVSLAFYYHLKKNYPI